MHGTVTVLTDCTDLQRRPSGDVRDQKIHSNVLTVHEFIDSISEFLRQPLAIKVQVVLYVCACVGVAGINMNTAKITYS